MFGSLRRGQWVQVLADARSSPNGVRAGALGQVENRLKSSGPPAYSVRFTHGVTFTVVNLLGSNLRKIPSPSVRRAPVRPKRPQR